MAPRRIQRRRVKGWRIPEGAVYVGRPTKWGNPFRVGIYKDATTEAVVRWYRAALEGGGLYSRDGRITAREVREELAGHDLVCWCNETVPCHADVLLEIANA